MQFLPENFNNTSYAFLRKYFLFTDEGVKIPQIADREIAVIFPSIFARNISLYVLFCL